MNRRQHDSNDFHFGSKAFSIAFALMGAVVFLFAQPAVRAGDNSTEPKDWLKVGVAWLYFNCGNTYDNIVRHDKAVRSYDQALKMVPESIEALDCRGYSLVKIGRVDDALKDLNRVIELKPSFAGAYFHRSEAYSQAKKFDLAKQDIETGIKLGGNEVDSNHAKDFMSIKEKEPR